MRPPAEKVERTAAQSIPLPLWLGKLLDFWVETFRAKYVKSEKIISLWINTRGNPLGNFDYFYELSE
jgi:hypothetical protein